MQQAFLKKPRHIILSIDGGGVRGAIAARILSLLEHELKRKNINKPLHTLFNMFIGSSTGALIVSGIAHCELSATYISDNLYTTQTCNTIMNKSIIDRIFGLLQTKPLYNGVGKRNVIQSITKDKKFTDTKKKVIIPLYDITQEKPVFFKSWKYSQTPLISVLDAASAAPGYFPSVEYVPQHWGIDSGVIARNPSLSAYIEMLKLYNIEDDIRILSIGTGYGYEKPIKKESESWGGILWGTKGQLLNLLMDTPMNNEEKILESLTTIHGHQYLRIDGLVYDTAMDNSTEENIKSLKALGDRLWEENKEAIIDLLLH